MLNRMNNKFGRDCGFTSLLDRPADPYNWKSIFASTDT